MSILLYIQQKSAVNYVIVDNHTMYFSFTLNNKVKNYGYIPARGTTYIMVFFGVQFQFLPHCHFILIKSH